MNADQTHRSIISVLMGLLLTVGLFAQTSQVQPVMTNATVEAMFRGGLPAATIVSAIKTATKVDFLIDSQAYAQLTKAGAADGVADQFLEAMHQRVIHGVANSAASQGYTIYPAPTQDQPPPPARAPVPPPTPVAPVPVPVSVPQPPPTTLLDVPMIQPERTQPRVFLQSASQGNRWASRRDQSMEMSKDFEKNCPEVHITINQQMADYTVLLNHIEVGFSRDNQFQIADKNGELISRTKEGGSINGGVKKACGLILADWAKR